MNNQAVSIENLSFGYPASPELLSIRDLTIAEGERVMLMGPSGSGKSTLLGLMTGVLSGGAGKLNVLGQDMFSLAPAKKDRLRADHIGYIFQSFNLVPYLSVVENIMLPCKLSAKRRTAVSGSLVKEATRLAGALGLSSELMKRPVTDLSIGQQQRVAAARALIGAPDLIIADEPTSSLDEAAKAEFLALLLSQSKKVGAAVLFVTHDRTLAVHFDRVVSLSEINKEGEVA